MSEAIAIVERMLLETNAWYWQHKNRGRNGQIEAAAVHIRIVALRHVLEELSKEAA